MKLERLLAGSILLIGISLVLTTASPGSNSILPYAPEGISPHAVDALINNDWTATFFETDRLGVMPNDTLQMTISTCGPDCAGDVITIQALDGGTVIGDTTAVADGSGNASFTFQAGCDPGALQVTFGDNGGYFMTAQLWVVDLDNYSDGPPTINCMPNCQ